MSLNDDFVKLLKTIPGINLQNLLMPVSDREIALSMQYMKDTDRNTLLSIISGRKAKRIVDELKLINSVSVKYNLYSISIKRIISLLKNTENDPPKKSYLRPKRGKFIQ